MISYFKSFFILLLFCFSFTITAQKHTIKGVVQDAISKEKLLSATVFVENIKDSSLMAYSITDVDGKFIVNINTAQNSVRFNLTFQGYKDYQQEIDLTSKADFDLGIIALTPAAESLDAVQLVGRKSPIVVKQDTIEFNAKSFNTTANATLEDVMKELPGVEIDKDGKITVNGKEVSKLLVNGKEFFGDDPQIALKNLPKEILDKIQVTESKTDEQKITGEAGDASKVEINVTLDEGKDKGLFSRFTAGFGTDDRYSHSGIANYFNKDFRVSVLASQNNINSPGFSFDEIYDAIGQSAFSISRSSNGSFGINGINFGAEGDGISKSSSAGFNISKDHKKVLKSSANYFYNGSETRSASSSRSTTFLPDRRFTSSSENTGFNTSDGHRADLDLSINLDTLTTIRFKPGLNYNENFSDRQSASTSRNEANELINTNSINNFTNGENAVVNLEGSFNRNLKNKGGNFYIRLNYDTTSNENQNDFLSTQQIFGSDPSTNIQNQLISIDDSSSEFTVAPSFRKKFSEKWSANASYTFQNTNRANIRSVFDRDNNGLGTFNARLSADFDVQIIEHRPNAGVTYSKDKGRISLAAGVIDQTLDTRDLIQAGSSFDKKYTNPYISFNANSSFGKFKSIYMNYRTSTSLPQINQLLPVENQTNPQNIVTGNPNLDVSRSHEMYISYNDYDWENGKGLYSGGGLTITENQVGTLTLTDENLIRRTTYVNLKTGYNGYYYSQYAWAHKKDKRTLKLSIGLDGNISQGNGFTNGVAFQNNNVGITPNAEISYDIKEMFDIELEYSVRNSFVNYDIETIPDQRFTNQNVAIDLKTFFPKNVIFGIRGEYNKYGNITPEFDDDSFVLIGSLGYSFAKDKANIKITAYDILNQVINTSRVVTSDFVSDTSSLVLQQYFMASFTYKFSKFGGKKESSNDIFFFDD